ncbi:MAG: hypothetical protein IJ209_02885 [Bacteroidaceae bacterium]|nr:hypothetical protein [Bacteroidaceae bacterium]
MNKTRLKKKLATQIRMAAAVMVALLATSIPTSLHAEEEPTQNTEGWKKQKSDEISFPHPPPRHIHPRW